MGRTDMLCPLTSVCQSTLIVSTTSSLNFVDGKKKVWILVWAKPYPVCELSCSPNFRFIGSFIEDLVVPLNTLISECRPQ